MACVGTTWIASREFAGGGDGIADGSDEVCSGMQSRARLRFRAGEYSVPRMEGESLPPTFPMIALKKNL